MKKWTALKFEFYDMIHVSEWHWTSTTSTREGIYKYHRRILQVPHKESSPTAQGPQSDIYCANRTPAQWLWILQYWISRYPRHVAAPLTSSWWGMSSPWTSPHPEAHSPRAPQEDPLAMRLIPLYPSHLPVPVPAGRHSRNTSYIDGTVSVSILSD